MDQARGQTDHGAGRWAHERRCVVVLALGLGALLTATAPALAQQDPLGQQLLARGIEQFANGDFNGAQQTLQRASSAARAPKLLGRIRLYLGLVAAAANRPQQAQAHFRNALAANPWLRIDPQRHKRAFVALFDQVRRSMEGQLEVTVPRPGHEVRVDGLVIGHERRSRRTLVEGAYRLQIRGPDGQLLLNKAVTIQAGQTTRVALPTAPAPPPAGSSSTPPYLWTWIAGGGAVALAGIALGLGLSASGDRDDACALLGPSGVSCDQRDHLVDPADRGRYQQLESSMESKRLTSGIAWGGAAALAVGAVVLYFVERRGTRTERPARSAVRVTAGLGGQHGLGLQLRF